MIPIIHLKLLLPSMAILPETLPYRSNLLLMHTSFSREQYMLSFSFHASISMAVVLFVVTTLHCCNICCPFLLCARLFISFLACHYCFYPFHVILTPISMPVLHVFAYFLPSSLASNQSFVEYTSMIGYMLCFSSPRTIIHFI